MNKYAFVIYADVCLFISFHVCFYFSFYSVYFCTIYIFIIIIIDINRLQNIEEINVDFIFYRGPHRDIAVIPLYMGPKRLTRPVTFTCKCWLLAFICQHSSKSEVGLSLDTMNAE